jgi:protein involved in polysaccharide export with SLBB domain
VRLTLVRTLVSFTTLCLLTLGPCAAAPIIHPGDTLGVDVMDYHAVVDNAQGRLNALNADNVVVAADGSISIPVAGTVHVAGKSTAQIARVLELRLATYVRDPNVTVRLLQQSQVLFLTGATTGTLSYLPGETLSSALGQLHEQLDKDYMQTLAPGDRSGNSLLRSVIDLRKISVERDGRNGQAYDGEELLRSGQPGPSLEPGDTLLFASKPVRVNVRGEVVTPGPIYLYSDDTLEQALLAAGGPLPSASTADASLLRDGQELPLPLGGSALRQVPQNGDTIIVRAAPRVTVLGQVPMPGEELLKNGSTLLSALYVAGGPTKWADVKNIEVLHQGVRRSYDLSHLQHGDLSPNVPLVDGDQVYVPEGHKIDASAFFAGLVGALAGAADAKAL